MFGGFMKKPSDHDPNPRSDYSSGQQPRVRHAGSALMNRQARSRPWDIAELTLFVDEWEECTHFAEGWVMHGIESSPITLCQKGAHNTILMLHRAVPYHPNRVWW